MEDFKPSLIKENYITTNIEHDNDECSDPSYTLSAWILHMPVGQLLTIALNYMQYQLH